MVGLNQALLLITVFYETLCPDSRSFFDYQLLPVMEELDRYIKLELVPYGKAQTKIARDGSLKFKCQHGQTECLGNKIHACAIKSVTNELTKTRLTTCMINNNYIPESIGKTCCEKYKIDWEKVENCTHGPLGSFLLKTYGEITQALNPPLTFVPTILINKRHGNQVALLKNFKSEVCSELEKVEITPNECKKKPQDY